MYTLIHKILIGALAAFTVLLISCGGGGGSGGGDTGTSNVTPAGKGTVTLLVTDSPTDQFKQINLSIIRAELLCSNGKKELFRGHKVFDLLQLTDVTEIFSVTEASAGVCSKIRLFLKQNAFLPSRCASSASVRLQSRRTP